MKEIIGFKKEDTNDDSVCPNCGWHINIPIGVEYTKLFKIERWNEYTCSKCGLQWKVNK